MMRVVEVVLDLSGSFKMMRKMNLRIRERLIITKKTMTTKLMKNRKSRKSRKPITLRNKTSLLCLKTN